MASKPPKKRSNVWQKWLKLRTDETRLAEWIDGPLREEWGPLVFLGDPQRFADGKALASYVGLIPREYSSGAHQRLGALTKQGSPFLRFLWNEAAAHAVRRDPDLQRFYRRKLVQKGLGKARVAAARKLGIRLWIMLRDQIDYQEFCRRGQKQCSAACAGMLETGFGAYRHRPVD